MGVVTLSMLITQFNDGHFGRAARTLEEELEVEKEKRSNSRNRIEGGSKVRHSGITE